MKNHITPFHFQALLVLRDESHFGRAASRLGIAQPQLSSLLRRIEEVAGFRIFERRPTVRLTPAGAVILRFGAQMIDDVERGIAEGRAVAAGSQGTVRIGLWPMAMVLVPGLSDALTQFADAHPLVELTLQEAPAAELYDRFRREELDLVVTRDDGTAHSATSIKLVDDRVVVLLPEHHRIPPGHPISLRHLNDDRFIYSRSNLGSKYIDRVESAAQRAGLNPARTQAVDSWSSGAALVGSGFGFTLTTSVFRRVSVSGTRFHEIKDAMPDVGFKLLYDEDRSSAAATRLVEHLKAAFQRR